MMGDKRVLGPAGRTRSRVAQGLATLPLTIVPFINKRQVHAHCGHLL